MRGRTQDQIHLGPRAFLTSSVFPFISYSEQQPNSPQGTIFRVVPVTARHRRLHDRKSSTLHSLTHVPYSLLTYNLIQIIPKNAGFLARLTFCICRHSSIPFFWKLPSVNDLPDLSFSLCCDETCLLSLWNLAPLNTLCCGCMPLSRSTTSWSLPVPLPWINLSFICGFKMTMQIIAYSLKTEIVSWYITQGLLWHLELRIQSPSLFKLSGFPSLCRSVG